MTVKVRQCRVQDGRDVISLLVEEMFPEVGSLLSDGNLDLSKTVTTIYERIAAGDVFVAYDKGACIGTLSLVKDSWWFAGSDFYADQWFYIKPSYRGEAVGGQLIGLARQKAEANGLPLFLHVFNGKRARGRIAETYQASPTGYLVRL